MVLKRNKTLLGAKKLHDAVVTTMGPKGRNVLIRNRFGELHVTHDGITVAKSVYDTDKAIQNGIDLFRLGSKNMDATIADGTSSVLSLSYNLAKYLNRKKLFTNPMVLRSQLEDELPSLLEQIDTMKAKINKDKEDVLNIARVSAEDETIAQNVAAVIEATGYQGAVSVGTMVGGVDTHEIIDGYVLESGFVSELFATNQESKEAKLDDATVVLINGRMDNLNHYASLVTEIVELSEENNPVNILFICNEIDNEILNTFILTKAKTAITPVVVKNTKGIDYLEDLAAVTGATIYTPSVTNDAPSIELTGKAVSVTTNAKEIVIVSVDSKKKQDYMKKLQKKHDDTPSPELEERLSLLQGRVGHIVVGGLTELEAKEKKDRYDDAIGAARAALKGGVVPGGGTALAHLKTSFKPLKKALKAPYKQLLKNAGIRRFGFNHDLWYGIDVMQGNKEVNLSEYGIIDPADRIKEELKTAISIVSTFITADTVINEKEYTQEQLDAMLKM
jgi:chaperonin GroEL